MDKNIHKIDIIGFNACTIYAKNNRVTIPVLYYVTTFRNGFKSDVIIF